jgi:hypothetical protein
VGFSARDILDVFQAQTQQGYKESKFEETIPAVIKSVYLLFLSAVQKSLTTLYVFKFTCRMVVFYVTIQSFTKVEFGLNHVNIFVSVM